MARHEQLCKDGMKAAKPKELLSSEEAAAKPCAVLQNGSGSTPCRCVFSLLTDRTVLQTVYLLAQDRQTSMKMNTQLADFTQGPQLWAASG